MATHTDVKGVIHYVQAGYATGDIAILSDCKHAWRVKKTVLAAASSVFRDLLNGATSQGNELHIVDETADDIAAFMEAICHKQPIFGVYLSVAKSRKAIELLIKFECIEATKGVLYRTTEDLLADGLFTAFALASRLGDIVTGCRILAQGYKWHENKMGVVRKSRPLLPDLEEAHWSVKDANMLQAGWVWALALASPQAGHRSGTLSDKKHWRNIVGSFMSYLTQ